MRERERVSALSPVNYKGLHQATKDHIRAESREIESERVSWYACSHTCISFEIHADLYQIGTNSACHFELLSLYSYLNMFPESAVPFADVQMCF